MGSNDYLYIEASRIIKSVRSGKARIKTLCFASKNPNKMGLLSLVTETCKNYENLTRALETISRKASELDCVLLLEIKRGRQLKCKSIKTNHLFEKKQQLLEILGSISENSNFPQKDLNPRYVRINKIITPNDEDLILEELSKIAPCEKDQHISSLLRMPAGTVLSRHFLYQKGSIVLQDKASCFPAAILDPPPGSCVVDACAAPGNKTTHLASLVGQKGRVHAFEKDPKRFSILTATLKKYGCDSIVSARCIDFLRVDPLQFENVKYALVDPSCSGSGILDSYEASTQKNLVERLKSLSNFQCMIIKHALKFPNLQRLVYSTCSIYREENEEVVRQILADCTTFRLVQKPLAEWKRRGLAEYEFCKFRSLIHKFLINLFNLAADVIRADPVEDGTHGFFVACFERISNQL